VALTRARDAEHYHGVLESNLEEYQRLSRMIDSLLFLARADDPQTRIEMIQLDTRKEFDAVREFYEGRMTQTSQARPEPLSRGASNQV